ncbi:type II secretion system protein [Vibrio hangzhouensis]|uniref:type II secretion system protein n=1 Tax=Vibrio hangzhouensis TaxID=462991 RepID=UPI001C96450D|nr:type II secretion system protein [Vibrio hangzhouensis]MBY6197074.1 type II secretion system GspH family protein [Vibrio hangzhouensis]
MKRQSGFTLIEMVVVIVILGILAVTAAPRFLNLQGDARESSLNGLKGAMSGATGIVYGKAAVAGVEKEPTATVADGNNDINLVFGYPEASEDGLVLAVDGLNNANEWSFETNRANTRLVTTFSGSFRNVGDIVDTNCYVEYRNAANADSTPTITVVATGC